MVTKTKPKKWEQTGHFVEKVLPALGGRIPKPKPVVPKNVRTNILKEHIPYLSKSKRDIAAEGIEVAVQRFLVLSNIDGRPSPDKVRARLMNMEKAANNLLKELQACDDMTWTAIAERAEKTPPLPSPKPKPQKRVLLDYLCFSRGNEPMDPPDRIIEQLRQYVPLFSEMAGNERANKNRPMKKAFPTLVSDLVSVWKIATGKDGKGNSAFTYFVEAVTETKPVRKIIPPVGDQRRKIQRAINSVST